MEISIGFRAVEVPASKVQVSRALGIAPNSISGPLCVGLGILPVTEGLSAPPFISRAFAF